MSKCNLFQLYIIFVFPSVALHSQWKVIDSARGSYHFPVQIILNNIDIDHSHSLPRWNLCKANWSDYTTACSTHITNDLYSPDVEIFHSNFINNITSIADQCIGKTNPSLTKPGKIWWNDICSMVEKEKHGL